MGKKEIEWELAEIKKLKEEMTKSDSDKKDMYDARIIELTNQLKEIGE